MSVYVLKFDPDNSIDSSLIKLQGNNQWQFTHSNGLISVLTKFVCYGHNVVVQKTAGFLPSDVMMAKYFVKTKYFRKKAENCIFKNLYAKQLTRVITAVSDTHNKN